MMSNHQPSSSSTSSRKTTATTSQRSIPSSSSSSTKRIRTSPPKYTVDRIVSSNGVTSEVLTLEDTPPLPTPTSSRSNSPYVSNGHSSRMNSNGDEPVTKKRKGESSSSNRVHQPVASTSYRKEEGGSYQSNGYTSSNKANGSSVKGKRNLDAYQGYSSNHVTKEGGSSTSSSKPVRNMVMFFFFHFSGD